MDFNFESRNPKYRIFAIPRPEIRSLFVLRMLNEIGWKGGFDMILNRLSDRENICPIEFLNSCLNFIDEIDYFLHKNFAKEYYS